MGVNLSCVGASLQPVKQTYDWRDVVLYALSVGATSDAELPYLLDRPAPRVLPTFAAVTVYEPVLRAARAAGADLSQLVHLSQRIEVLSPFPSEGELETRSTIRGIWDMMFGALLVLDTESSVDGTLISRGTSQVLLRGAGGFGGERPPMSSRVEIAKNQGPLFEREVKTHREQALLYRLTGDLNPLHALPEVAQRAGFERPILHGLCTYGIAARVAFAELIHSDPARFRAVEGRFEKPVLPGDTLIVRGYALDIPGRVAITVTVAETGEAVMRSGLFEHVA